MYSQAIDVLWFEKWLKRGKCCSIVKEGGLTIGLENTPNMQFSNIFWSGYFCKRRRMCTKSNLRSRWWSSLSLSRSCCFAWHSSTCWESPCRRGMSPTRWAWKIQMEYFSVPNTCFYKYLLCLQNTNTCCAWEIQICGCLIVFNFVTVVMIVMMATWTAAILSSSNFSWQSLASSMIWSIRSWEHRD